MPTLVRIGLWMAIASVLPCRGAHALPTALSEDELIARSDVVGLFRVLSVACLDMATDAGSAQLLRRYGARLRVLSATKGASPSETIEVAWQDMPSGAVEPWVVRYYPGEEVQTSLVWDADTGVYETTWWNAKREDVRAPDYIDLPTVPGQVFYAQKRVEQKKN